MRFVGIVVKKPNADYSNYFLNETVNMWNILVVFREKPGRYTNYYHENCYKQMHEIYPLLLANNHMFNNNSTKIGKKTFVAVD